MRTGDRAAVELEAELIKLEQMKLAELRAYWSAGWGYAPRLPTSMNDSLVHDLAKVDAVAHHVPQSTAGERAVPENSAAGKHPPL